MVWALNFGLKTGVYLKNVPLSKERCTALRSWSELLKRTLPSEINTTHNITEGSALSVIDETLVDLSIYPNPVEDQLTVKTSTDVINKIATVFDINGKRVLNMKLKSTKIDVTSLTSGIYFLRLESYGKTMKRKFIKK